MEFYVDDMVCVLISYFNDSNHVICCRTASSVSILDLVESHRPRYRFLFSIGVEPGWKAGCAFVTLTVEVVRTHRGDTAK